MASSPYFAVAQQAAQRAGIDPNIFARQINQESGFNPGARSPAGASGIAQIVARYHPDAPTASDPVGQLHWAANYLSGLVKQYGGYAPALSVYNSGRPDAYKDPNFANGQAYNYVKNILGGVPGAGGAAPLTPMAPVLPPGPAERSSPLTNPIVQNVVASNDKLLGVAPPPFPQATQTPETSPKRMTQGATGQLTYQIQGHATQRTRSAISLAEDYLGTPYVWGGDKPGGFDCSGLLQYVWARSGVSIPRTTYDQFRVGTPVSKAQLQPGDAVFFTGSDPQNGLPGHVGMYLGGGKIIEAPHTGADVQISNLSSHKDFVGGRRFA